MTPLNEPELQHEILQLRRRVEKLATLLRLVLALLRASGFTLSRERLPDGRAKMRILRAIDRARACIQLRALLRFLSLSPSRFHAWRRQDACALADQSSCPRTSPHRLTPSEVRVIEDMVTAPEYRHVPAGTLAVLAQRLGKVWASPSTWYHLVRKYGWRRPRLRLHPAKPKIGLRTTRADEMWHIDALVHNSRSRSIIGVYPGFPTLFWGLSVLFVGDLMGKALWKLVENAARFPRRGGRVLCVHGAVSFHRARPCGPRWLPGRGAMRHVELDRRVLGLQSTGE